MSRMLDLKETGELLMAAQKLILCCHVSPDCDTLGSALGLKRFLEDREKEVLLLVDDVIHSSYMFLPGAEQVVRPEEGKEYSTDLLVVIDASSWDRIGSCTESVKFKRLLNIDHHVSNTKFAEYLFLDTKAAAVGEIMTDLFAVNGWEMDKETADCFYAAISTDCGSFRYSNTTPKTMRAAAMLLERGVRPDEINGSLDLSPRASIELLAKVLPSICFAYDGRVAYITLPHALYDKDVSTEAYVNIVRYIEGVDVGIFFKEVEPGVVRVSMRSAKTDVAQIAVHFDGGGHIRAAGCTVHGELPEARQRVLTALGKVL